MAAIASRPRTKLVATAAASVAALIATLLITVMPAHATTPTIKGPDRVFTLPDTPLPFTGVEPLAAPTKRNITVDATDAATCDPQGSPSVTVGCSAVQLDASVGTLSITAGNAVLTVNGTGTKQLTGHIDDLNTALSTLIWTPPLGYQNLPDTPAHLTVNATDGASGDQTSSGSPDSSWTIDLRVALPNLPPSVTDPTGPISVGAGLDEVETGNTYKVADPDANNNGEQGEVLLVKWVDCGSFDVSPSGNYAAGDDIKALMKSQFNLTDAQADSFYALLPNSIKNLQLSAGGTDATAFAAIGTLDDINNGLSTVTFHAPASASTCTMHDLIDDLGAHGLPGQYENETHLPGENPTGIELPAMLFDLATVDYVVAGGTVPHVDVEQAPAQADPTGTSPIDFTATFDTDVTGFTNSDVAISGTAGATTAVVTPVDAQHYDIAVSGMTQNGTVIVDVPAGAANATIAPNNANTASTSTDHTVTYQVAPTPPTVTINQAAAQADPTSSSPINFTVVFSAPVTGFSAAGVTLSGTAGATTPVVTGSGDTYNVAVSGMTQSGTVIADVPAGAAQDASLQDNTASTSTDHTVTYNLPASPTPPTVTINQAAAQADPTSSSPINFTVVFSAPVTGFSAAGVTLSGTAGATTPVVTGSGDTYNVAVSGMTQDGTVIATVNAGAAQDASLQDNTASTSTDNTVTYVKPVPPTVTINQAAGQADPTSTSPIQFDIEFSAPVTGFVAGGVQLSGTAGATTVALTGSGASYTASVTGMTQSGTVIATIPAGAAQDAGNSLDNTASTSTDNTVTYDLPAVPQPLTVTINQAAGQADPTSTSPIQFDIEFSAPVTGFVAGGVQLSGTAGATTVALTGSGASYTASVTGMTQSGTVIATIPADVAQDASQQDNAASTSTDNVVNYVVPPPPTTPTTTSQGSTSTTDPGSSTTSSSTPSNSSSSTSSTTGNGSTNNGSSAVQGESAVQPVNGTLPFTGSNSGLLVLLGSALTLGGLALVVITRRRRQATSVTRPF
jgi:hypothetical protein